MKKIYPLILTVTLFLVPFSALAREFEITPFVGYQFGGDVDVYFEGQRTNVGVNDSENWGLMVNIELSPVTQLELLYSTQDTQADARRYGETRGLKIDYWQIGMLYSFNPYEQVNPFVVFGIGATNLGVDGLSSNTRFSGNIGGGAKFLLSDRFAIRLEGRFYSTYINSTTTYCDPIFCYGYNNNLYQFDVTAGLVFRFGS